MNPALLADPRPPWLFTYKYISDQHTGRSRVGKDMAPGPGVSWCHSHGCLQQKRHGQGKVCLGLSWNQQEKGLQLPQYQCRSAVLGVHCLAWANTANTTEFRRQWIAHHGHSLHHSLEQAGALGSEQVPRRLLQEGFLSMETCPCVHVKTSSCYRCCCSPRSS